MFFSKINKERLKYEIVKKCLQDKTLENASKHDSFQVAAKRILENDESRLFPDQLK